MAVWMSFLPRPAAPTLGSLPTPTRPWPRLGFLVCCLAFAAPPVLNAVLGAPSNKDYDLWFAVGQQVLRGEALYPHPTQHFEYIYPPTLAVFVLAPLSALGYAGFVTCLVAVNAVAWYLAVRLSLRLFAGAAPPRPGLLAFVACVASAPFVYDTFLLGQVNLVLLVLMLGMFTALRGGRPWAAGGFLAVAAAVKAFPVLALPYLVWRRHWRAAAATAVWLAVILVLLPAPVRGFQRNAAELRTWFQGMLADQSGQSISQRDDSGFTYKNQSMVAVIHRLTRPVEAGGTAGEGLFVNVLNLSPGRSQAGAYAALLALGLAFLGCMPPRDRQTPTTRRCEQAMLLLLMVLCSPLAWTYFYCWTLPAWVAALRVALDPDRDPAERRAGWRGLAVVAAVMAAALTQPADHTAQALGVTMWGAVGLFALLGWFMRREARRPADEALAGAG